MMTYSRLVPFAAALLLAAPISSDAQSLGERLKQRAAERAKQRGEDALNRKTDEAVDKAIDGSVNVVKCVVSDSECIAKAKDEGRTVVRTDKAGKTIPADVAIEKNAAKKAAEAAAGGGGAGGRPFATGGASAGGCLRMGQLRLRAR